MKALELLKRERQFSTLSEFGKQEFDEAIKEIEELQDKDEQIECLKHNYDVQTQRGNIAYTNYTKMVNSLEQRIKELEDLQNRSCDGCKFKDIAPTEDPCAICSRLHEDQFEPKE